MGKKNTSRIQHKTNYNPHFIYDWFFFRYGGWYLDHDVIVLRNLTSVVNSIGCESNAQLNNAVMHAVHHHPFLTEVMTRVTTHYAPSDWPSAGPKAATAAASMYPHIEGTCSHRKGNQNVAQILAKSTSDTTSGRAVMHLLPDNAFNPISWMKVKNMWGTAINQAEYNTALHNAYTLHMYSRVKPKLGLDPRSLAIQAYKQSCLLCLWLKDTP